MDAARTILKGTAFLLPIALLIAVPGRAQTLTASPSSVALSGGNPGVQVNINAVSGGTVSFTVSKGASDTFYNVSPSSGSTPATLSVTLGTITGSCLTSTCSGTITVTPSSGTALQIPVTFTPGSGGGGGGGTGNIIVFSPTSTTLSSTTTTGSVNVSTSNGSALACNASSNAGWLVFSGTGTTFTSLSISGSPVALSFTAFPSLLASNPTNPATITLNCGSVSNTFTVTFSGTGTGTSSFTLTPSSVVLGYPNVAALTFCSSVTASSSCTVSISSTTTTTYNAYVSSAPSGNFLTLNSQAAVAVQGSTASGLLVAVNPTVASTLTTGSYQATVTIYNSNNFSDQTTLPVTLQVNGGTITGFGASPSSVAFTGSTPAAQQVTILSAPTGSFYFTLINAPWLTVTPACNSAFNPCTSGQVLTLTPTPAAQAGLLAGQTYSATLTVISGTSSVNVPITYSVTGVTTTSSSIAGPPTLSFAYQIGRSIVPQNITIAAAGAFTATATVNTTQQWLKVGGLTSFSATGPTVVQVFFDPTGLPAGSYQGFITVATASGSTNITVNLLVSSNAVVQATPGSINLSGTGTTSQSTALALAASDGSNINVSLTSSAGWITVTPAAGTTPATFQVTVNPSTLCNGLNVGTLALSAPGAANSSDTIPVAILVSGSSNTNCATTGGNLTFTPSTGLTFNATSNTSSVTAQSLSISSSSTSFATVTASTANGINWLLVNGVAGTQTIAVPNTLSISVNPTLLANNTTYTGQLIFTAGGLTQTVNVTLNVGSTATSGNVTATPTSITVTTPQGTTPTGQTVTVSAASGTGAIPVTVATVGNFFTLTNASGQALGTTITTPATFTINLNPTGLTPGQQNAGSITLTPTGGTPVTIPVTFTVQPVSTVSASPATLTFSTYQIGNPAPSNQSVSVTGGSGLTFSATAQSQNCGNWLTVSPATGATPATLNVGVNTSAFTNAGTCNGTITVAGTGTATGSTTINVQISVTAPLPTITQIGNAGSYVGGSIAPGEIITIFGTGLGPSPAVTSPTVDTTGLVSTTLGGVQVLINGFAAPMIYASNTQISAVVPYEVARFLSATIIVRFLGQTSNGISAAVVPAAPGLFTANASGTGPGAILNSNLSQNTPGNPANKGDVIALYMTGEGQTAPAGVTGKVTQVASTGPLTPQPLLPLAVTVDGIPAAVTFYGEAPGLISGVMQVNVVIPPGARSGAVPVVVTLGTGSSAASSQSGVTVSVK